MKSLVRPIPLAVVAGTIALDAPSYAQSRCLEGGAVTIGHRLRDERPNASGHGHGHGRCYSRNYDHCHGYVDFALPYLREYLRQHSAIHA